MITRTHFSPRSETGGFLPSIGHYGSVSLKSITIILAKFAQAIPATREFGFLMPKVNTFVSFHCREGFEPKDLLTMWRTSSASYNRRLAAHDRQHQRSRQRTEKVGL
jgi:hypothetical protein